MAQALGGAAGPNPHGAFVLQRESMTCEDAMLAREDFQAAAAMFPPIESASSGLRRVGVLESHGDCVSSLPPNATLLASSPTAAFECFSVGDTVLSWQGHPELSSAAMERKILPYVESLSDDDKKASRASWKVENDALLLVAMARGFLRGGICGGDDADDGEGAFCIRGCVDDGTERRRRLPENGQRVFRAHPATPPWRTPRRRRSSRLPTRCTPT